jgi:hypothetical protein
MHEYVGMCHQVPYCAENRTKREEGFNVEAVSLAEYRNPSETSYTSLRHNLASVLDHVVDQQETVIVRRKGSRDVALVPA